jgi:hypothetical protein
MQHGEKLELPDYRTFFHIREEKSSPGDAT